MFEHKFRLNQKVRVLQSNGDSWKEIHNGVIVSLTSHFAKVFRYRHKPDDEGDVNPESAEFFAINGPKIKIV